MTEDSNQGLQLVGTEWSRPANETPWSLRVARFLAPLALACGAVASILALPGGHNGANFTRRFSRVTK